MPDLNNNMTHSHASFPECFDTLWINANLITLSPQLDGYGHLPKAAIASHQGKICFVGQLDNTQITNLVNNKASQDSYQIIDLNHLWVTPGLIDCHTHIVYAGNRASEFEQRLTGIRYDDIAKQGGGILSTVKATREASHEQLMTATLPRIQTLLDEGVTTIEIKSGYGLTLEDEIKMLEVAKSLAIDLPFHLEATCLAAHTLPPEYKNRPDDYIQYITHTILPEIQQKQLATSVDAFCETIGFSPAQVNDLFKTAKTLGFKLKLHAEQLSDQKGAQLASDYCALSADHLEYISEESIQSMAQNDTVAVLLPGAFYYLHETQKPPVALFRKHQVPMAIATDCNPGSSPCTSLLLMLNMACTLFQLTPEEALKGITIHAAQALDIEKDYGSLETGKIANLAIWDIQSPAELSYTMGQNPCVGVVYQGNLVLEKIPFHYLRS